MLTSINMEKHTTFTNKEVLRRQLLDIVTKSEETYRRIDKAFNESLYPIDHDSYHFIVRMLKPTNNAERALFSLLYRDIYQSETISGDSAKVAYTFALAFIKELLKNIDDLPTSEKEMKEQYMHAFNRLKTRIEECAVIATKESLRDAVDTFTDSSKLSCAIWEALNLSGLEGKILIENGKQDNFIVESKIGYSFELDPFKFMLPKIGSWDRTQVKVLIVDGLIEKVSEIDLLLHKAYELKQPFAIIAHGFSEEVVATCRKNNDHGNFDVMPIRMKRDIASINIVKDVATVCNTMPVTHLMGQLVSGMKWDDLPTVDRIIVTLPKVIIENEKSVAGVAAHVQDLLVKRQRDDLIEDVRNLLDQRLRCLVSSSVIIHLPDVDSMTNDSMRVQIDRTLRNCKTVLSYGTVSLHKVLDGYPHGKVSLMDSLIEKALRSAAVSMDQVPTLSAALGVLLVGKTSMMLVTSSGYVERV